MISEVRCSLGAAICAKEISASQTMPANEQPKRARKS
jgi:hypothetical protein